MTQGSSRWLRSSATEVRLITASSRRVSGWRTRRPGAGQRLERLHEVLTRQDVDGPPRLQRGADAVGAGDRFGEPEPRPGAERVERRVQALVADPGVDAAGGGVGEGQARRRAVEQLAEMLEDGPGGVPQTAVGFDEIELVGDGQRRRIHAAQPRTLPRMAEIVLDLVIEIQACPHRSPESTCGADRQDVTCHPPNRTGATAT